LIDTTFDNYYFTKCYENMSIILIESIANAIS